MIALTLALYVLAVARITRFINYDALFDRPRVAIVKFVRGNPTAVYFLTCPWCVSIWVALGCAVWPMFFPENRALLFIGLALAASHIVGMAAPLSADAAIKVEWENDDEDGHDTAS